MTLGLFLLLVNMNNAAMNIHTYIYNFLYKHCFEFLGTQIWVLQ